MINPMQALCFFLLCVGTVTASVPLETFVRDYCITCHGPEKQKGDIRFDGLKSGDGNPLWHDIYEQVARGDMPPRKAPKIPDTVTAKQALEQIAKDLARSEPETIALRRMNRTEYEHTVNDLLGTETALAELLPEDSSVQGFDNVADGLSISSVLMERYLEAANTAFDGVIRRIKPLPAQTRRLRLMDNKENIDSVKKKKGGVIEREASFVKFTPGWPPARIDAVHPIENGIYRCRLAVWPHDPGDRTLSVAIYVGPLFGAGKRRFMGMYDVTGKPEEPRIIEFTTHMTEGHTMHIVPWIYPKHITWRDKHEKRPGIGIAWAETHGPLDQSWPAETQTKLMGPMPMREGDPIYMRHRKNVHVHSVTSEQPKEDIARILKSFTPQAFRRPVDDTLVQPFIELALDRLQQGRTFEQSLRAGFSAVLCSPHFLLINRETPVDDYTLASRLSYFLWSSMPDQSLLKLAAEGKLQDPDMRRKVAATMLKDPKAERFIHHFTGQWLGLRDIDFTTPDRKLYPEFDALLQESMLGESRAFFRHLLKNDQSVHQFIKSDFTFLNERLARHYNIPDVNGHEHIRLVNLPKNHVRGGILSQASVMKVSANGTTSSPVLRGLWVLDRLLGQPAAPPPPDVPAVEPDIRGAITIREQLNKHREIESCARCHLRIDPPGFALECFDPIGGYRERYRSLGKGDPAGHKLPYRLGLPVECNSKLPDGRAFANYLAYRELLWNDRDQVARTIAEKLLVYGTGRPMSPAGRSAIDAIMKEAKKQNYGLHSIIQAVVAHEGFVRP